MTQEEKQLLLKDLCGRLPYGVWLRVTLEDKYERIIHSEVQLSEYNLSYITTPSFWIGFKPYLRSMSSMTSDEKKEFDCLMNKVEERCINAYGKGGYTLAFTELNDWLDKNMFDYRGLISMELALKAPKGMYKTK